jgi:hypothetical protein
LRWCMERNGELAAGWDNARSSLARRCPGWIPPGAQTSAAPSGPAPPESLQACDSKLDHLLSLVAQLKQTAKWERMGELADPAAAREAAVSEPFPDRPQLADQLRVEVGQEPGIDVIEGGGEIAPAEQLVDFGDVPHR